MMKTLQVGNTTYYTYTMDGTQILSLTKLGLLDTIVNFITLNKKD